MDDEDYHAMTWGRESPANNVADEAPVISRHDAASWASPVCHGLRQVRASASSTSCD
jgi:hypothetical protein